MTMWHPLNPFPGLARAAGAVALLGVVLSAPAPLPARAQDASAALAEAATSAEELEPINKALSALERVAAQLTSAMMNPAKEPSSTSVDTPPSEFTKF